MLISVVIRTLNEEKYLDELLSSLPTQDIGNNGLEIILVDSGSTDGTLAIAKKHHVKITHINKAEFSFGGSLNKGCDVSNGDVLVFLSGHCIPCHNRVLINLCQPIINGLAAYTYGRQVGRDSSKYSEQRVFAKYFPDSCINQQEGFFCNNANAALSHSIYQQYRFDESLTGLEDMFLAKQVTEGGGNVAYVSTAPVYHIHDEQWPSVRLRYQREAIALQKIMPEVHMSFLDFLRCLVNSTLGDLRAAMREKVLFQEFIPIFLFRFNQYWGGYLGNHEHRQLSAIAKRRYFYPNEAVSKTREIYEQKELGSGSANESEQ